jgi:hypothetical protein
VGYFFSAEDDMSTFETTYMAIECFGGETLSFIMDAMKDSDYVRWGRREGCYCFEVDDCDLWITNRVIKYLSSLIGNNDGGSFSTKIYSTSYSGHYFLTYITPKSVEVVVCNGKVKKISSNVEAFRLDEMCPELNIDSILAYEKAIAVSDEFVPLNIFK